MGLTVRIEPVEKSVEATIRADLDPATQKKEAAAFAKKGIDEATATNRQILGREIKPTVTVDGVPGAPLENVNPDGGSIIAEWDILVDGLLRWIAEQLIARSPVVSGAYRQGHTLYVDGTEVPIGGDIRPSAEAEEYVFLNPIPYARRIEVGKTKAGRDFVVQVPNHIYERVAKDARARFGNQAKIEYSPQSTTGAYRLKHNQAARHFLTGGRIYKEPKQRRDRAAGAVVEAPAIVIRFKE
jgi:hypothetical protein